MNAKCNKCGWEPEMTTEIARWDEAVAHATPEHRVTIKPPVEEAHS